MNQKEVEFKLQELETENGRLAGELEKLQFLLDSKIKKIADLNDKVLVLQEDVRKIYKIIY